MFPSIKIFIKNNKFYLSDNNGNIEIFAKNEGGYLFEKNINYGSGNSKIAINDEGNILVVDYLGKAMVYSTSNEKVVTTFTTSTSSTSHEINNVGDIVVVVSLSSVNIYNTDTLPFVSFVGKIKVILIILDVLSLIVLCLAILSNFEKTRNKLVKVGKLIYRDKVVYLYLLPVFAGLILFTYYPIAWGITLAFENYTPGIRQDFVGFDNFKELFSNIEFWISFKNMGIFLITDIFKAIVPPIIAAEAMHALISKRTQYWARFVMYIPGILPGVAAMLLWKDGIFGYDGVISQIFGLFGVDNLSQYAWLGNASTAKWALIFIGFPWVGQYLIYYGALSSIPESIYEAAELDGFSWARRIISIDIPMIGAQIKYILVTTFIGSIQNFSRVYLTTNGAFDTNIPALELYTNITKHQNYGAAATMGLILFLIIFGISFRQLKGNMRED